MTKPGEASGLGGDAFPSASRGDRSGSSSPVDPPSDLISRERVRELLRAMNNLEAARLAKLNRWNRDTHWQRIEAAYARVREIEKELGL